MATDAVSALMKLAEGTLLVRFEMDRHICLGRMIGEEVEPFDDALQPMGRKYGVRDLKFMTPIDPVKIWCIGLNYREHARESKMAVPDEPCVFMKPRTCLIAHGEAIKIPAWTGRIDYEGELAVVIGKTCRNVNEGRALDCVLGYSCFNDVSARVLQHKDGQWVRAKGFDTFGPFGPGILIARGLPATAGLTTCLNGNIVQKSSFGDMIFSVGSIIAQLSRFATLEAGDIIATGTPSGVGPIRPGDTVEISVEGIGTLKNPVVAE